MPTLLVRLCGPMQSWGTRSRFSERDTELEPSKSGVIGLLCAALGWPRERDVGPLAALKMGVRVDNEGAMGRDYHTAGGVDGIVRASGQLSKDAVLSNRYYLAEADFLVGLEGEDDGFLREIERALISPRWQIFLGRKSFVPSVPVYLPGGGLRPGRLPEALSEEPWPLAPQAWSLPPWETARRLRLVLEATFDDPGHEVRLDQPLGAAFRHRTFGPRPVVQLFLEKEATGVPQPSLA
jgi:CRISPR system Cascade subunit CasD